VRDNALRPYRANVYINRPGREPELRNYDLRRQNTVFTYTDTSPEGWWDPKIVLAYSKTQIAAPEYFFDVVSPTEGATSSFNGKVENRFALDIGSVTAGFDFYNDKADLDYLNPTEPFFTDERATN
ncbi:MAG: TonB-dependent receptor, partial [Mesorhizobium sp.]